MHGTISFYLFFLGVVTTVGQASAVPTSRREPTDVHLEILGSGSGDMIAFAGNSDRRTLRNSNVHSFGVNIEMKNKDLEVDSDVMVYFYGPSGKEFDRMTVRAPKPGGKKDYYFCLDANGETEISTEKYVDDEKKMMHVEIDPNVCPCGMAVCFDPHLQGLRGQHIKWARIDGGWYALVKDDKDKLQINVRTTAPMTEYFPDRQFITGMSVLSQGHSLVVEVKDPYTVDTQGCSADVSPCLANGGLSVSVDRELVDFLAGPTNDVYLAGDIDLASSNLPAECREFGGRKVWARMQKDMEQSLRHLATLKSFEEWMLSFKHMVAPEYCAAFVANSDLSKVQSDQALLRIVNPTVVVRLSVGTNHRRAGKTDGFGRDLPALDFWQMGVGVEGLSLEHEYLFVLLGETARVVLDAEGNEVMEGAEAFPWTIADYRVSDAEGTDFTLLHN